MRVPSRSKFIRDKNKRNFGFHQILPDILYCLGAGMNSKALGHHPRGRVRQLPHPPRCNSEKSCRISDL